MTRNIHLLVTGIIIIMMPMRLFSSQRPDSLCADSVDAKEYVFKPKQLILPGALMALGTFGVYNKAFKKMNRSIREGMNSLRGDRYIHVDDYIQFLPAVAYLGMDYIGVKAKHPLRERLAVGVTAYASMAIVTNVAKYTIREPRPDSGRRNSFPSGHSATVFAGAELVREEYGLWPGIGAYTVATGVAFLRLYNGRHWLNDVLAGAGVGILSARIGYWMLPVYRRWFKWSAKTAAPTLSIMPGYDSYNRGFCFNLVGVF